MTTARAKPGIDQGFSLAELVLVLACAAILLGAAVPNIDRLQKQWNLWGAVRLLETSLQWGRMHAIASNDSLRFEVADDRSTFYWVDPSTGARYDASARNLPAGVSITACPRRPLRFYQHGNAVPAGTYTVAGATGSYSVIVSPGGRIRIRKD